MNKRFWKIVTIAGFFVAILAIATVLVLRVEIFKRLGVFSAGDFFPETQELSDQQTQMSTQQTEQDDLRADKKNLERLAQGCLSGNDCIPAIDKPEFVSARRAYEFLDEDDLIIGLAFEGWETEDDPVKAYPLKIMSRHEIVNDFINETPVVVTYCPLSMTPRAYVRLFDDGKAYSFGVSGMLLNSNLVMYDRETKSLWSQFDGQALAGPKRGQRLEQYLYPLELLRWSDWVKKYPATVVLAPQKGNDIDYDESPYGDYEKTSEIFFPLEYVDNRLAPKEIVFGIMVGDQSKVYPESELRKALPEGGTVNDDFVGRRLALTYDGMVFKVLDEAAKEEIPSAVSFYFTWVAFHPNTRIFQAPGPE